MKYIKQFLIILLISFIGEILKCLLPLPVPASIYGMAILFFCLMTKIIKLDAVKETGKFDRNNANNVYSGRRWTDDIMGRA